jgi:hypothetical protein
MSSLHSPYLARAIGTAAACAAMLGAAGAHADGECYQGFRDSTATERETMTNVIETALHAMPPAPQGWVSIGDETVSVITRLCKDVELTPWRYSVKRSYQRTGGQDERSDAVGAAAEAKSADIKAKQPQLDALMAKNTALSEEAMAAAQKGEFDRLDAINAEIDANVEEYQRIMDEGPVPEQVQAATTEALRDTEMRIEISINPGSEGPDDESRKVSAPAGTQAAFRWNDADPTLKDEHALVLLGQWKPVATAESVFEPVPRANAAPTAAQSISVSITADEKRLDSMIEAMDWKRLAALLAN